MKQKLFVVKKYIMATSASDAIKKEKTVAVDDCWIDDDWRGKEKDRLADAIGFTHDEKE